MTATAEHTLLIVEDEAVVALREKKDLESYGYRVQLAHTGEQAVTMIAGHPQIELVLMDIDLGSGITGVQAAEAILKHREVPIVFLSSHTEPEIVEKTEQVTSYGYVVKNSSITVLDASIKMAFRLFEASSKLQQELAHRTKAEEDLNQKNTLLYTLLSNLQVGVFMVEAPSGKPLLANQAAMTLLGRGILPDVTKKNLSEIYQAFKYNTSEAYPPEEMPIILGMYGQSIHIDDMEVVRPDGTRTLLEIFGSPIKNAQGEVYASLVSFIDITERKKAEAEIAKQLAEKETLLKEVHHRIKNNISSVQGLLSLQADSSGNPEIKAALEDAASRVQGMRVLYDTLLMSENYSDISIKTYTEELIEAIIALFPENLSITIEKRISEFTISTKTMTLVGIILNELLTNIYKYAFKGRPGGHILIVLEKIEKRVSLIIKDDGVGIDPDLVMSEKPGFGLTIVRILADQLKGNFQMQNTGGTTCTLSFEV